MARPGAPLGQQASGASASDARKVDRVFHRWVEVYLPRIGWFPVDPTRNDFASRVGAPYRYFGRLPWSYLSMSFGDGNTLDSGVLGWDYRSNTRWLRQASFDKESVVIQRYAVWSKTGAPGALAALTAR